MAADDQAAEKIAAVPRWDPEQQVYVDGIVPENAEVKTLIEKNGGSLRLFGYGSLCWNPGTGALAKDGIKRTLGRARGYKRCWAQKSTDHRGRPAFPGIVCTLLEDSEVADLQSRAAKTSGAAAFPSSSGPTMTEGVIYLIPPELVDECLDDLDFREKGGYARDVINVVEDETGETHQALLYRGTPDNPAFWSRALLDLPLAAAVMSVSEGPSGKNDYYIRKHYLEDVSKNGMRESSARYRVFGCPPGTYGIGILDLIEAQNWKDEADFAKCYINWGGYAYSTDEPEGIGAHSEFTHLFPL